MGEESLERNDAGGKVLQPHVADYSPVRTHHHHQPEQEPDEGSQQQTPEGNQQNEIGSHGLKTAVFLWKVFLLIKTSHPAENGKRISKVCVGVTWTQPSLIA
ncbi:hypothetical protein ZHAS_00012836 [Anopheles sinensis]|uniref:Uncharacterized protein n=1 Tax=Anopheles sinensis TaxID=74873 RepID=A0A084W3X8_ANOSI|nr:hypothetical protein ZHAS_00012836 [Anopheles sinensis]